MQRVYDVRAVREQFPALGRTHNGLRVAYFDGPGGSQAAKPAIDAVARYMEEGGANLHGPFPTSVETEEMIGRTRHTAAAFLGARPEEVSFGPNMTTLTFAISRAIARTWEDGSEIVVTELDLPRQRGPLTPRRRREGCQSALDRGGPRDAHPEP